MRKKRILVVDDEASITTLLRLNLEKTSQYVVRTESAGEQVLPAIREFKPDIVLLDVMMPGASGGEIAGQIRSTPAFSSLPVIFLTAVVRQEELDAHDGVIGGFPYIAKPLNVKGVISIIEKYAHSDPVSAAR